MASAAYPNRHQYAFLQKLRACPNGLPSECWPNPATWKRWMNHDGFCRAMKRLMVTQRVEQDLFAATAGARASRMLHDLLTGGSVDDIEQHAKAINALCRVVRVDHLRQKEVRSRAGRAKATPETSKADGVAKRSEVITVESANEAVRIAKDRLEWAEIEAEAAALPNPFPDFRRGLSAYYNPVTNRRELPDDDVPADECGRGMDRVTKFFAQHARKKEAERRRREAIERWCEERQRDPSLKPPQFEKPSPW